MTPGAYLRDTPLGGACLLIGQSGEGKTYALDHALGTRRLVIIDPFASIDRRLKEARAELVRHRWTGDIWTAEELMEMPRVLCEPSYRLIVDPAELDEERLGRRVNALLDVLWDLGFVDIVLEEAGNYSRQSRALIFRVASGGARIGLRLFVMCQNAGRIGIDAFRGATRMVIWRQQEPRDQAICKERLGDPDFERLLTMKPKERRPILWQA